MKVGAQGVAMFGKSPSEAQLQLLFLWKNGRVFWIPDEDDPDSVEAAIKKTENWNLRKLFAGGAYVVRLPKGDPADYGREELWSLIKQQTAK